MRGYFDLDVMTDRYIFEAAYFAYHEIGHWHTSQGYWDTQETFTCMEELFAIVMIEVCECKY